MKHNLIYVTPELAEQYLCNNISNRPIRGSWVKQLSSAIERGEWKLTHQGIAFSKTGKLIDGQHRLMAIIKSGIPCHINVSTEVDDSSYIALDIGAKRNMNDIFDVGSGQAEVLRFAAKLIFSGAPTPSQVGKFIGTKFHDSVNLLHDYSNYSVRLYSSAPLRAAASFMHMIKGGNKVIFEQYGYLCKHDFDGMDSTSKSFVKSIMAGSKSQVIDQTIRFSHGLKLFDPNNRNLTVFRILDSENVKNLNMARNTLREMIKEN